MPYHWLDFTPPRPQIAAAPVANYSTAAHNATFYKWRSRFGGMEVSDARKLKGLEEENRKLKKLLAESMLDVSTLKEMLGKNF